MAKKKAKTKQNESEFKKTAYELEKTIQDRKSKGEKPVKASKKEPRSIVWTNGAFKYKEKDDGTLEEAFVVCQQCKKTMKKASSTTNLINHLKGKHPQFWKTICMGQDRKNKGEKPVKPSKKEPRCVVWANDAFKY